MTTTESPEIIYCTLDSIFKTNTQYICYKHEVCCPNGCCSRYSYRYFQSWYFWVIVMLFFVIYYLISWYCKRLQKKRFLRNTNTDRRNVSSSVNSSVWTSETNEPNVDNFLEQLIFSYRNQHSHNSSSTNPKSTKSEPPPKYEEALLMPKPLGQNELVVEYHQQPNNTNNNRTNLNVNEETVPSYDFVITANKK